MMKTIKICRLGNFKHSVNFKKITTWESAYFRISALDTIDDIDVDHFRDDYTYPNSAISNDMGDPDAKTDLLISVVDQPLEENYYMHRLGLNKAVISIFPVLDHLKGDDIPVENFIVRCIYEMVIFLYEGCGGVEDNVYEISHHETRGCLFDMNVFIDRIIFSSDKPIICKECETRLRRRPLPDKFIEIIARELKRIRKPLYFRINEKIKKHPIFSLFIACVSAIVLNIIAMAIYDIFKN